jgi:hypothetical protein
MALALGLVLAAVCMLVLTVVLVASVMRQDPRDPDSPDFW